MHAQCRERRTCREAVCNPVIGEDLGGSSDQFVEIDRRLKWIRFPCEQHLDMGQSVLTPEEDLLGKVGEPVGISVSVGLTRQWGKGNSDQDSETGSWGTFMGQPVT